MLTYILELKTLLKKVVLISGGSAVGKTAVLRNIIPLLQNKGMHLSVCKIDCVATDDAAIFNHMNVPCVVGISGDICPDHFLVSNLHELYQWSYKENCDILLIETAGLCHRCSPATQKMLAGCVIDCTSSCRAPAQLGPMLTHADFVVLTKIDMVSQAEREIILWKINEINPNAKLFTIDGLTGYGAEGLSNWLDKTDMAEDLDEDILRHSMPSGVCSYCVGEKRVGSAYQQGVVGKIEF